MSEKRIAVYAGSFDPITLGHQNMIEKAVRLFDELHIVIAINSSKKSTFSVKERDVFILDVIKDLHDVADVGSIEIHAVKSQYVVSWAKDHEASFLVRGIRDVFDYAYESTIYEMNKSIQSGIETIYLMPDAPYRMVSSSTVKGLVGYEGWQEEVAKHVPPSVLCGLGEMYVRNYFMSMESPDIDKKHLASSLEKCTECYRTRPYHNILHIAYCLELFEKYRGGRYGTLHTLIPYSLLTHDVSDTEEQSANYAANTYGQIFGFKTTQYGYDIRGLVMATLHTDGVYYNDMERFIASIDLGILGSTHDKYKKYMALVEEEYRRKGVTEDQWTKGRYEFLDGMLKREFIYPDPVIREELEDTARLNMKTEMNYLSLRGLQ